MTGSSRPKRSLGQNFLVDPNLQRKIVAAVEAEPGDPVLEIGPGRGALTEHLVELGVRLWAVELDDGLAAALDERFGARENVSIVHEDVLETDLPSLVDDWGRTRVVGNIPYNITTPILFHVLTPPRPRDIVMMVQSEVADRITATPGTKTYGALAVGVQTVADAVRLFKVPASAFRPVPRVDSAVVRITPHDPPRIDAEQVVSIRRLTRAAFSWRRKQLGTTLRKHADLGLDVPRIERALGEMGIEPTVRPEMLTPEQFVGLAERLF